MYLYGSKPNKKYKNYSKNNCFTKYMPKITNVVGFFILPYTSFIHIQEKHFKNYLLLFHMIACYNFFFSFSMIPQSTISWKSLYITP